MIRMILFVVFSYERMFVLFKYRRTVHRLLVIYYDALSVAHFAGFLFERLGDKCPKIVRVFSENLEKFEFPIPRESLNIKARHRKFELLGKEMHKEIALHHLVRKEGNRFAKKIKAFDALFARNKNTPENVSDEEVEKYQKLLTDACMAEIKKYDVILATCSASPSNRIQRGANVTQCIIDECGMCQEPESLIPLVCFKPKQVSVISH